MFITVTFKNAENKDEVEYFCSLVRKSGFEDFCFVRDVEHYQKTFDNPSELMGRALDEIKKSDYLLIDLTDKPTGRAYEAGMAFALGKKVIVILKKGTQIKDTTRGIATKIIEYENLEDIVEPLSKLT
jgi:nucleoside 2-deoxyribosyltransferase